MRSDDRQRLLDGTTEEEEWERRTPGRYGVLRVVRRHEKRTRIKNKKEKRVKLSHRAAVLANPAANLEIKL